VVRRKQNLANVVKECPLSGFTFAKENVIRGLLKFLDLYIKSKQWLSTI
jgi:hypothetical protein